MVLKTEVFEAVRTLVFGAAASLIIFGLAGALVSFVGIFVARLATSVLFHLWFERPIAVFFKRSKNNSNKPNRYVR
jgi:hypothetical protein